MSSVSTALSAQLIDILLREQTSCQALLETVEAERHAIKSLAIGEFHPINVRRIAVLEQLQSIADAREQAVRQIADSASLPGSISSLQVLLDRWNGSEVSTIRHHHDALMVTAKRVREEIKLNVVLIENFRGFIEQALTAGATAMTDGKSYSRTGKPASGNPTSAVLYQQG
ncbi:MAG: flagellar export chaperone FlgN [Nitrospira sp.]|nr:flagellar export chaperone FlgN [Nitrospira sp.]